METVQITQELWKANQQLKKDDEFLNKHAIDKATTEKLYRKALAKKIIELRDQKIPATLINDLAKGDEEVSEYRFARDLARVMYDVAKSSQRSAETQISSLQSILKHQTDV